MSSGSVKSNDFLKFSVKVGKKGKKWGEVECFSIFVLVQVCNDFFYW